MLTGVLPTPHYAKTHMATVYIENFNPYLFQNDYQHYQLKITTSVKTNQNKKAATF